MVHKDLNITIRGTGGNPVSHFIGGHKITNKPYAKRMALWIQANI